MKKRMIYEIANHREGFLKLIDTCHSVYSCALDALEIEEEMDMDVFCRFTSTSEKYKKLKWDCYEEYVCELYKLNLEERLDKRGLLSINNDFRLVGLLCRNLLSGFYDIKISITDEEFKYTTSGGLTYGWTRKFTENYIFIERDFRDGSELLEDLISAGFKEDDLRDREKIRFYNPL